MENFKLKVDTPFYKVTSGQLKPEQGSVYLGKGDTITGIDIYLFDKKSKKVIGHVIKIKENRYIPFDNIQAPISTTASNVTGLELDQPEMEDSISMATGNINSRNNPKSGDKKMYIFYEMAVPPYYSITGKEWNKDVGKGIFYSNMVGGDGDIVEMTVPQLKEEHRRSGSKKKFNDWMKSGGKDTLGNLFNLANQIIAAQGGNNSNQDSNIKDSDSDNAPIPTPSKPVNTIMGMHPVTFSIVAFSALGLLTVVLLAATGKKG